MREKLLFAIAKLFDPDFEEHVKPKTEKKKTDSDINKVQLEKFVKLYRHAFSTNEYFRKKYEKAGLTVNSLKTYEDIKKIPYLTKQDIIACQKNLKIKTKTITYLESGGTTGKRLNTLLNKNIAIKRYQMLLRILYGTGWRIGLPSAAFYSLEYSYWNNFLPLLRKGKVAKLLFDFIQQFIIYGLFHNRKNVYFGGELFEYNTPEKYLKPLFAKQPKLLVTRPDVINVLMKQGSTIGTKFSTIESIVLVGNILTESIIKRLKKVFGAAVYNMYASTELGYIGVSCKFSGVNVHVDHNNYLIETDKALDNEIIVTDFNNYMIPIIRYRTGDVGALHDLDCQCGNNEQSLKVQGRTKRYILSESGRKIYEYDILEFFDKYSSIFTCQIQKEPGDKLRIVANSHRNVIPDMILDEFCQKFNIDAGKVLLDTKASLIRTPSGKLCGISNIA